MHLKPCRILILGVALALAGCAGPLSQLVKRDLDSAVVMAKGYGTEKEAACFEALRAALAKVEEIGALDSDGVIAATYKAWLLRYYRESITQKLGENCLPVIAGMGAHLLTR